MSLISYIDNDLWTQFLFHMPFLSEIHQQCVAALALQFILAMVVIQVKHCTLPDAEGLATGCPVRMNASGV